MAHQDNPLQDDSIFFVPTTLQFNESIERGERHLQWNKVETFPIGTKLVFIGNSGKFLQVIPLNTFLK